MVQTGGDRLSAPLDKTPAGSTVTSTEVWGLEKNLGARRVQQEYVRTSAQCSAASNVHVVCWCFDVPAQQPNRQTIARWDDVRSTRCQQRYRPCQNNNTSGREVHRTARTRSARTVPDGVHMHKCHAARQGMTGNQAQKWSSALEILQPYSRMCAKGGANGGPGLQIFVVWWMTRSRSQSAGIWLYVSLTRAQSTHFILSVCLSLSRHVTTRTAASAECWCVGWRTL